MLSSVWTSRFSRDSSDHLRSSCSSSSSAMPLSGEHVMAARTWCHTVTDATPEVRSLNHGESSRSPPSHFLPTSATPLLFPLLCKFLPIHSWKPRMQILSITLQRGSIKQDSLLEICWKSYACHKSWHFFLWGHSLIFLSVRAGNLFAIITTIIKE